MPLTAQRQRTHSVKSIRDTLEASNVNVVTEMVDMITITRDYESNQKVIQTIDSTLEKSVALGRI